MSPRSFLARALPLAAVALIAAPLASPLEAQYSTSGHQKDKPPYYHGKRTPVGARIAWAPVLTPATRAAFTRRGDAPSGPMQALLDTLNASLAAMMKDAPRVSDERLATLIEGSPEIRFGCEQELFGEATRTGQWYHSAGCVEPEDKNLLRNSLWVQSGTKDWRKRAAAAMAGDSAQYLLLLSLRIGDQYPWSGWRGKGIRLGTGYDAELPWLSAVDKPVTVVQLVGTVVDREGKPVRSGAEGLFASKPGGITFLLGGQQAVSDKQLAELLAATRREDLPGKPQAWEVALRTLVSELTNQDPVALGSK